ncbi:hypothetical protein ACFSR6_15595 [Pedobacter vanadiisoli]|uniref:Uncharacterized protein n=1 Tax=Pedobacter vanadiisoli TaxID=1761975 RepID=A0ABW5MN58_9SPHI
MVNPEYDRSIVQRVVSFTLQSPARTDGVLAGMVTNPFKGFCSIAAPTLLNKPDRAGSPQ